MRRLTCTVLVIALATAGCIGSSSSSPTSGRSDDVGVTPLKTDLTIRYSVPTCPPSAHCVTTSQGFHIVSRRLTCSPDGGDYDDPAAVCHALTDLVKKLSKNHPTCACPLEPLGYFPPRATGIYQGKRRTIPLDGCSLCGAGDVLPDAALLIPVS
jgi:hypothetical protein